MQKVTGAHGAAKGANEIEDVGAPVAPASESAKTGAVQIDAPSTQVVRSEVARLREQAQVAADTLQRDFGALLGSCTRELRSALDAPAGEGDELTTRLRALASEPRAKKVIENVRAAASDPLQLGTLLEVHRKLRAIEALLLRYEPRIDAGALKRIRREIKDVALPQLRALAEAAGDVATARAFMRKAYALSESDRDRHALEKLGAPSIVSTVPEADGLPLHRRFIAAGRKLVDPQIFRDLDAAFAAAAAKSPKIEREEAELRGQIRAIGAEREELARSEKATPAALDALDARRELLESKLGRLTAGWRRTEGGRAALAAMEQLRARLLERAGVREAELIAETVDVSEAARLARGEALKGDLVELTRLLGTGAAGVFDRLTASRKRAAWDPEARELDLGADGGTRGALFHEAGHAFEAASAVLIAASKAFVDARATGPAALLSAITGAPYAPEEKARPDDFISAYVGREYARGFTEVFSTGLERFSSADSMLDLLVKDREHFMLVLGMVCS